MDKEKQKKLLSEIMQADEKDGLYKPVTNGHTLTAVEWMAIRYHHRHGHLSLEDIEKAKQMMKEQICKSWDDGNYAYFYSKETGIDFDNGEQYYKETYEKT